MSRKQGTSITSKFVRGLITEATALSFPEDACTEVSNVIFDPIGQVSRRKGFDTEPFDVPNDIVIGNGCAYGQFNWEAVSGNGNVSFLVVQTGASLYFYNTSTGSNYSEDIHATIINLNDFLPVYSDEDVSLFLCQFADGNGDLFVTSPVIDPFYISYDVATDVFTTTVIELLFRDFEGLDDGLEVDERPTDTVTGLETSNPNHYYNLLNQGYYATQALALWDSNRTDLPSNADYVAFQRESNSDPFSSNTAIDAQATGNQPAPKGHYILPVAGTSRQQILIDDGYTFIIDEPNNSFIPASTGTIIGTMTTDQAFAFDGITSENATDCARDTGTSAYIGKDFGVGNAKSISSCIIFPSNDFGYHNPDQDPMVITLYGNNTLPANGTDGTVLGSVTITVDDEESRTIQSSDITTAWRYVWCNYVPNASTTIFCAEMLFFSSTFSFQRPTTVAFFAGRVFYGGIQDAALSNNIYFSQIIETTKQYGFCYQKNDPTSEQTPDLLPDDGGIIKIPEMGTIKKLYSYQNALIVLASNGIWLIQGSSGSSFKADDYAVKKISSIGMDSPDSLMSIKGLPAWWGEDGIYTVEFDANYDSFTPVSLTIETIDTFYKSIPDLSRKYVKAAYDITDQIGYWLYSSDPDDVDPFRYDSVLCLDSKSKAFYIWTIGEGPLVRAVSYVKPADRSAQGRIKYLVHQDYDGATGSITFGEHLSTTYRDWVDQGTDTDYDSYFITGFKLDGETQRFFQPNYIFVFLKQEDDASCFIQGIFDFTTDSSTGKWSTTQQVYNNGLLNRGTNFRRLKMRGKGRALQLKFTSESSKPFSIIGWSILESSNSNI